MNHVIGVPCGSIQCSKPAPEKVRQPRAKPLQGYVEPVTGVSGVIKQGFVPQYVRRLFDVAACLISYLTGAFAPVFVSRG